MASLWGWIEEEKTRGDVEKERKKRGDNEVLRRDLGRKSMDFVKF